MGEAAEAAEATAAAAATKALLPAWCVLLLMGGVAASVAPEAAATAGLNALRATIMLLTAAFDAGVWLAPKVAAASRSLGEATLLLIHLATTWISALVSPYATAI